MSIAMFKTTHYWTLSWSRWIQSIYYAYFRSIIKYGIIFWDNSTNSVKIFTLQEKIFRIMVDVQLRTSCRSLFKELEKSTCSMPVYTSIKNFIINNQEIFQTNSSIHNINTRNKLHLHRPNASLPCFQKSTFYTGIKIFNSLPPGVTILKNDKAKFKSTLRKPLHTNSF